MALVCGPGVGGTELHQTPYYNIGLQRHQTVHGPSRHSQLGRKANRSQGKHKNKYMGFLRTTENGRAVTQVEGGRSGDRALEDEKSSSGGQETRGQGKHRSPREQGTEREASVSPQKRAPPLSFSLPAEQRADVHCSVS